MNNFLSYFLVLFFSISVSQSFGFLFKKELIDNFQKIPLKEVIAVDNTLWNKWLRKYVKPDGKVNYKSGKKDFVIIKKYVDYLLTVDGNSLKSKSDQLAYHLNLYNALIIYGVLRYYPIKSVRKIQGVSFFHQTFFYRGKRITINDLEQSKILAKFKEPLVHFALNCASYSCPPLKNKAYIGKNIKKQLIEQTQAYLKNKEFARLDQKKKILHIIELFKWYKKDLGNPIQFYQKYNDSNVDFSQFDLKYIPYNWLLNSI